MTPGFSGPPSATARSLLSSASMLCTVPEDTAQVDLQVRQKWRSREQSKSQPPAPGESSLGWNFRGQTMVNKLTIRVGCKGGRGRDELELEVEVNVESWRAVAVTG
jgi:hypothetical protein